jgi:hypothetical protein
VDATQFKKLKTTLLKWRINMRKLTFAFLLMGMMGLLAFPCLAAEEKAAPAKPAPMMGKGMGAKMTVAKAPVVKLERVEIASYWGFYSDGILDKEGQLTAGRRGPHLVLAFVYSIENPNNFRIMLDDLKFTVAFEGFELNTVTFFEDNYVPAKTTDQFRYSATFDFNEAAKALAVVGGHRVKEMNTTPAALLKKWWEGIADFDFPITVNGTANFQGPDGKAMYIPFEGTFPPKP